MDPRSSPVFETLLDRFDTLTINAPTKETTTPLTVFEKYMEWAKTLSDEQLDNIMSILAALRLIQINQFRMPHRIRIVNAIQREWRRRHGHNEQ